MIKAGVGLISSFLIVCSVRLEKCPKPISTLKKLKLTVYINILTACCLRQKQEFLKVIRVFLKWRPRVKQFGIIFLDLVENLTVKCSGKSQITTS